MSNLKAETTEPDPAATSLSNDDTVNKEGGDPSAPTDKEVVMAAAESKDVNGASDVKEEKTAETSEAATDVNEEIRDTKAEDSGVSLKKEDKIDDNGVLKTKAQVDETRRNHSKYDPSVLPTTDDPKKIRAQVEFYFSDANLPSDKHLWNLTDGELNLPVSISEICKFGRMKRFQPMSAIVAALRESDFLEITGPEGHEQVKRKVAYDPTATKSTSESRSVYVKGFGDEEPSSQFDIEAFFAQFGPTNAVRLRRSAEKLFKGSVFVEFADEETAQNFLALEPKPLWKGKHPLKFQPKKEYMAGKIQDIRDGKMEPAETWSQGNRGRGRGRGNNYRGDRGNHRNDRDGRGRGDSRGDRDPDDWKKRREEDRASGFKDDRHRNDRGRHGRDGDRRGGRGRGRGGRDDRGPRPDDRNRERREKDRAGKDEPSEKTENEKKRVREEDDGADEKPAKKVDSKSEESPAVETADSPATNGKKRAREDDEAGDPSAKKVDTKSEVAVEAS